MTEKQVKLSQLEKKGNMNYKNTRIEGIIANKSKKGSKTKTQVELCCLFCLHLW